ncbi:MAG: CHAT domain-containing protein [Planctomycetota bacterium]|nr:CHAT domain-containing protein [Planctomycetota bacterium]
MQTPRNVTLEILRHGPAHNQLLSPLTRYLALCGNHSPVTVNVPYEHNQYLARYMAFDYRDGADNTAKQRRELELQIVADEMSQILAGVPGLISELAERCENNSFTHFELVLSASELALLPFELANAPNGFPGAGQPLALQSQAPLCITRRVRRVENERFKWPDRPRVLFAAALPRHDEGLVLEHVTALRGALSPWVRRKARGEAPDEPSKRLTQHLTILPRASEQDLVRELSTGTYTHVHILAHGVKIKEGVDERFGLALYDEDHHDTTDLVSSSRLATIMRSFNVDGSDSLSQPTVLTVASCHGGAQGSVVGAGSSVAHALHEAGIPLVVSSQFPLSFAGSTMMVDILYRGLLWGHDPRVLLNKLRRQLKSHLPNTHDWASLVTYAALPNDLDAKLARVRIEQARRSIDVAFRYSDEFAEKDYFYSDANAQRQAEIGTAFDELESLIGYGKGMLEQISRELEQQSPRSDSNRFQLAEVYGLLGSTVKREAEAICRRIGCGENLPSGLDQEVWKVALRRSQAYYQRVFKLDRSESWALVQDLSVSVVLEDPLEPLHEKWELARLLSETNRYDEDRTTWAWSLSNLIELSLMSLMFPEGDGLPTKQRMKEKHEEVRRETLAWAEEFMMIVREDAWEILSQRRQLYRYLRWYYRDYPGLWTVAEYGGSPCDVPPLINGLCQQLLQTLPS